MADSDYVLVTAARDEEKYIAATIESIVGQTLKPKLWVIANDGSKDATAAIVEQWSREHRFICLLNVAQNRQRDFASKAYAIEEALAVIYKAGIDWDFLGNLDADITLSPGYFKRIIERFKKDPKLGLAGGWIQERNKGEFRDRTFNSINSVPGAIQFFRRGCFEATGTYPPLPYGGEDWYLEVLARQSAWRVRSFPEEKVFHNRPTGKSDGSLLKQRFREGRQAFSLGSHPLFELIKSIRRIAERPLLLGAAVRFAGYLWPMIRGGEKLATGPFISCLREQQRRRMKAMVWL